MRSFRPDFIGIAISMLDSELKEEPVQRTPPEKQSFDKLRMTLFRLKLYDGNELLPRFNVSHIV
ncbi:MAG: hypothetical protein WBQ32_03450 [Ignavibacteriaceae bacterium]